MKERKDEWQPIFFDKTYSGAKPRFNPEPNAFLVEVAGALNPGRALDIHMGQGRNAVYLAKKGWDVTGFDFSPVAVAAAHKMAGAAGVRLTTRVCRHDDFDFGTNRWDLIVMSYTWLPLEAKWTGRIIDSLRPGGRLVFEHLMDESGSENRTAWLPRPNELPRLFSRLRTIRYEDTRTKADWSWRPERVARLLAERDFNLETVPIRQ
jgi:SAM-dependent methyltransferase